MRMVISNHETGARCCRSICYARNLYRMRNFPRFDSFSLFFFGDFAERPISQNIGMEFSRPVFSSESPGLSIVVS